MEKSFEKTFKKIDLMILLSSLLLFSLGVGLLHGDGQRMESPESIYEQIAPLLETNAASQIAKLLVETPDQILAVVKRILDEEQGSFSKEDKIRLILKLVRRVSDRAMKEQLLALLALRPALLKGTSPLYIAARGKKTHEIIPTLVEWTAATLKNTKDIKPEAATFLENLVRDGFIYAIDQRDSESIKKMIERGVILDKALATTLLLRAVEKNVPVPIITSLITAGADTNAQYSNQKGSNLLTKAIDHQNVEMIKALLHAGANINDPAVGQALKRTTNAEIDKFLRSQGAHE